MVGTSWEKNQLSSSPTLKHSAIPEDKFRTWLEFFFEFFRLKFAFDKFWYCYDVLVGAKEFWLATNKPQHILDVYGCDRAVLWRPERESRRYAELGGFWEKNFRMAAAMNSSFFVEVKVNSQLERKCPCLQIRFSIFSLLKSQKICACDI